MGMATAIHKASLGEIVLLEILVLLARFNSRSLAEVSPSLYLTFKQESSDKQTHEQMDATKYIISLALRSIKMPKYTCPKKKLIAFSFANLDMTRLSTGKAHVSLAGYSNEPHNPPVLPLVLK